MYNVYLNNLVCYCQHFTVNPTTSIAITAITLSLQILIHSYIQFII